MHRTGIVGRRLDVKVAHQPLQLILVGIGNHQPPGGYAAFDEAADQRGGHVAAADKCKPAYVVQGHV